MGRGPFCHITHPFYPSMELYSIPPGDQWKHVGFGAFWPNPALRWLKCSKHPQNQRVSLDCCPLPAPDSICHAYALPNDKPLMGQILLHQMTEPLA